MVLFAAGNCDGSWFVETTKKNIETILKNNGVGHSTLQIECSCVDCDNSLYCQVRHDGHEEMHNH